MAKLGRLTLQFLPYSEIGGISSVERIKKLLSIILENKIIILQGKLKPEEESRLIEDTMALVGHVKKFKGVELAVISSNNEKRAMFKKIRHGIAKALVGDRDALTIIGPAAIIKDIKKDPKKIELMFKT